MTPQKIKNLFSGIVGIVYVLVGIWAITDKRFIGIPLDTTVAVSVGILMIAYGCFRIYRAYRDQ